MMQCRAQVSNHRQIMQFLLALTDHTTPLIASFSQNRHTLPPHNYVHYIADTFY